MVSDRHNFFIHSEVDLFKRFFFTVRCTSFSMSDAEYRHVKDDDRSQAHPIHDGAVGERHRRGGGEHRRQMKKTKRFANPEKKPEK